MGFLDRAKKLAGQAKDKAEQAKEYTQQAKDLAQQAKDLAQRALDDAMGTTTGPGGDAGPAGRGPGPAPAPAPAPSGDTPFGTPYVPGMLGRPGWRERGLTDPAAVLPIAERDRAGVPRSTRSQILEEPFGMGRRWSGGAGSAGLYYQLYPEHYGWEPPGGKQPFAEVAGASAAVLGDGRSLVFLAGDSRSVVLEVAGLDDAARAALARAVAGRLTSA